MTISTPTQITVNWASSGDKNTIPIPSQSGGAASFTAGFPPLTMTPKASGGVPPSGKDMNGILFSLSQAIQYEQSGGHFPFSSAFASAVGGYPIGAIVQATDNSGFWVNGTANNTTDPEAFGAGWQPLKQAGVAAVSVASTDVTLTALKAGKDVILITGTLTQNVNIIVPTWVKTWAVVNNATLGTYSITVKTASGTGAILLAGANSVTGDGTNVLSLTYLLATKVYADAAATAAKNDAIGAGIGVNQTWQDISGGRLTNTSYTNNTGKPIFVEVSDKGIFNHGLEMTCTMSGSEITVGFFWFAGGDTDSCISAIIPNGASYKVYIISASSEDRTTTVKALNNWSELR